VVNSSFSRTILQKGSTPTLKLDKLLKDYKTRVETAIDGSIPSMGGKTHLRDACEYALKNGGKRIRPIIVYMVGDALRNPIDVSPAALAIEFFHTASLVADDLPCMDDDDERRFKPSLHKVYGETLALLVSYGLIAAGYACLSENAQLLKKSSALFAKESDSRCVLALENATYNTGLFGATGGQFLDVCPPDLTLPTLCEVIRKKTSSLFEISFVLGWLFAGGSLDKIDAVKKVAAYFGMAFQIADDIADFAQDSANANSVNLACVLGMKEASERFYVEIDAYLRALEGVGLNTEALNALAAMLVSQVKVEKI